MRQCNVELMSSCLYVITCAETVSPIHIFTVHCMFFRHVSTALDVKSSWKCSPCRTVSHNCGSKETFVCFLQREMQGRLNMSFNMSMMHISSKYQCKWCIGIEWQKWREHFALHPPMWKEYFSQTEKIGGPLYGP